MPTWNPFHSPSAPPHTSTHIQIPDEPSSSLSSADSASVKIAENLPPHHLNIHQVIYVWLCRYDSNVLFCELDSGLNNLFLSLFITCLIIADVIGVKLFAFPLPFQVNGVWSTPFSLTVGTVMKRNTFPVAWNIVRGTHLWNAHFPGKPNLHKLASKVDNLVLTLSTQITFLLGDVINEYYGPAAARRTVSPAIRIFPCKTLEPFTPSPPSRPTNRPGPP